MKTIISRDVPWKYIVVFVLGTAAIGIVGRFYYQQQKEDIREDKKKELATIIELKVEQIVNWRTERYADALTIYQNRLATNVIHQWLENRANIRHEEEIVNWLENIAQQNQCKKAYLFDKSGILRLSAGLGAAEEIGAHVQTDIRKTLQEKKIIFGDFEKEAQNFGVHLDVFVPLIQILGSDTVSVAAILFQVDPQAFFFPLLRSLPILSTTSEALLFRQEGDSVVFINETKNRKHPPLSLRLPVSQGQLPAATFFKGGNEFAEGQDYAGIPVLAAMRKVPDSPWSIVVKVSIEEMYAPIRNEESAIGIISGLLILTYAAVLGMLWRHERSAYYKKQYQLELERKALAEHYDYATKFANDIIIMADQEGRIVDVNERGVLK